MIVRRIAGWFGELLVTLGVLVLLFAAWQLWWTDVVSNRAQTEIVATLEEEFAREVRGSITPPANGIPPALTADGVFAVLRIPRFGDEYARPIVEGTGRDVLALGVGHYEDTAGPGQVGNFALAGHRTTFGRPLHDIDKLSDGDLVVVETLPTVHVYAVTSSEIVLPTAIEVIAPVPSDPTATPTEAMLTLTSCHPKFSATERFITHAKLVESIPRESWDPARLTASTGG